ncbi:MAG: peptidase [Sphingobacteriales bacterium]|nr:peptidase [Sphingobacteriales bacterium]
MVKQLLFPEASSKSIVNNHVDECSAPTVKSCEYIQRVLETTFTVRMRGKAMEQAGIPEGSYVIFDSTTDPKNGNIVCVYYNDEYFIRFYAKHGSMITLYGCTADIETIRYNEEEEGKFMGVVTWSLKLHNLAKDIF